MDHQVLHELPSPRRIDHERATDLLARYPDVTNREAREILNFLRDGRYLDVGLLTSNSRLKPNLDAFLKDHWVHFHVKPGQGEAVVGITVLLLFVAWAIWAALA